MHFFDWLVMLGTLLGIVAYGVYRTRNISTVQSYLHGDHDLPWWTIGLSVMATQASAITFLSTPGQAYEDGMGFAQFYFGLPVAMVILCVFVLPIYYRLNVYTAYEYLEGRFDLKTRTLTAILFLVQRGLAAGVTIYAPAIILSTILGWNLNITILFIGVVVIFYTVAGGTKAVSVTQKQQMIVILLGMVMAAVIILYRLPEALRFNDVLGIAGKMGKLEVVDFKFDLSNRYNFWSGMIGGVFLFLSYFGTDQSQVQRYLSGKSLAQGRLGLLFNGIFKVPMQFLILFVGILVFVFFLFVQPPVHFNSANVDNLAGTPYAEEYQALEAQHDQVFTEKREVVEKLVLALKAEDEANVNSLQQEVVGLQERQKEIRLAVQDVILRADPDAKVNDKDYVFITFITKHLPEGLFPGLVGLLLAVIFSAAMSSTSSELNALATTTVVDLYRRQFVKHRDDRHYLSASKWFTILWGGIALLFAASASLFDNLIQMVNIIGSLFYGAILGVFMIAFFMKKVGARATFIGALVGELIVLIIFGLRHFDIIPIAYLWLNLIGCALVMIIAALIQGFSGEPAKQAE